MDNWWSIWNIEDIIIDGCSGGSGGRNKWMPVVRASATCSPHWLCTTVKLNIYTNIYISSEFIFICIFFFRMYWKWLEHFNWKDILRNKGDLTKCILPMETRFSRHFHVHKCHLRICVSFFPSIPKSGIVVSHPICKHVWFLGQSIKICSLCWEVSEGSAFTRNLWPDLIIPHLHLPMNISFSSCGTWAYLHHGYMLVIKFRI